MSVAHLDPRHVVPTSPRQEKGNPARRGKDCSRARVFLVAGEATEQRAAAGALPGAEIHGKKRSTGNKFSSALNLNTKQ